MERFSCPICNTVGLTDYTKSNVVCPQCNSDLKPFMLLHSVSAPKKYKVAVLTFFGVSLLSIVLLGLFLTSNSEKKELIAKNAVLHNRISQIQSIDMATTEEKDLEPEVNIQHKDVTIQYVVRKGDSLYKIAQFFYNDGTRYTKIEKDNNLAHPHVLRVGQVLKIKIPQE